MSSTKDIARIACNINFRNEITNTFPNAFSIINLPRKDNVAVLKTYQNPGYNEEDRLKLGLLDANDYLLFSSEGISFLKTEPLKTNLDISPGLISQYFMEKVLRSIRTKSKVSRWEGTAERKINYPPYARVEIHHIYDGINFYRDFNPKFEDILYLTMSELEQEFQPHIEEVNSEIKNL